MAIQFKVHTPLGVTIRITKEYWNYLVTIKHPIMKNKEDVVENILRDPQEIRKSRIDKKVFLYYKTIGRLYCVVAKHENESGYIITAYPVNKLKEGDVVWRK